MIIPSTIDEVAAAIAEVERERGSAGALRIEIVGKLNDLISRIRQSTAFGGRMNPGEYASVCAKQRHHKADLTKCEIRLAELAARRRALHAQLDALRTNHANTSDSHSVVKLRDLRRKYAEFAADPTRVASMRTMAAAFAEELGDVLRLHDLKPGP